MFLGRERSEHSRPELELELEPELELGRLVEHP
jgi:hypothetical protein